jgi:uncharacterized protein with von Willebrand factor type A (vWA) domain
VSKLAANLMHFGRVLRHAGLPLGPGRVLDAIEAAEAVGITRRQDLYWALHTVFVHRRAEHELFHRAFELFWRDPAGLEAAMAALLPRIDAPGHRPPKRTPRRLAEALAPKHSQVARRIETEREQASIDAVMTWSHRESFRTRDFDDMSSEEIAEAKRIVARMRLHFGLMRTRRRRGDALGARVDVRATFRASLRSGGQLVPLRWSSARYRPRPIVVLCDISGSMDRYSRMLLAFVQALSNDRDRVFCFVFGTHLTNVTRHLRHRDIDVALAAIGDAAGGWGGGTRIGHCLAEFNLKWSRRVLGHGAIVLLVTDGLDRDDAQGIERQMERLQKSCGRLVWLNPLLRFEGFEAKTAGARAIAPHVDEHRPVHDLESLGDLARALSGRISPGGFDFDRTSATRCV